MAVLSYRVREVERVNGRLHQRINDHERDFEAIHAEQATVREQITGEGGLQNAIKVLRTEMGDVRRALYALTAALIVGTVTLATAIATHAV